MTLRQIINEEDKRVKSFIVEALSEEEKDEAEEFVEEYGNDVEDIDQHKTWDILLDLLRNEDYEGILHFKDYGTLPQDSGIEYGYSDDYYDEPFTLEPEDDEPIEEARSWQDDEFYQENKPTFIHLPDSLSDETIQEFCDLVRARQGWAIARQAEEILGLDKTPEPLEEKNSNALEYIADFAELYGNRHEEMGILEIGEQIKNYLKKEGGEPIEEALWSGGVKTKHHTPKGLFSKSASDIAKGIKRQHKSLKSAMSALNFYINRGGKNISDSEKAKLNSAKNKLRALYGEVSLKETIHTLRQIIQEENKRVKTTLIQEIKDDVFDYDFLSDLEETPTFQNFPLSLALGEESAKEFIKMYKSKKFKWKTYCTSDLKYKNDTKDYVERIRQNAKANGWETFAEEDAGDEQAFLFYKKK